MKSTLQKAFSSSPKLDKDELLSFVFWCRQIIALIIGIGAGVLGFTGIYVFIGFFVALFLISYLYYSKLLNINEEDFG